MESRANHISVSVFAYTDVGRQRSGNEDAFLIADLTTGKVGLRPDMVTHAVGERGSLLVVSDGMGGAVGGEVASELAVTTIRESLLEIPPDLNAYERLKMATEVANEVIWKQGQRDAALAGMGATVTAALVQGMCAHIAQVGDSRAYVIRGGQIKQVTKDQSYAQMLVDSGVIKPEQMDSVPKNVISQALGAQPGIKVALTSVEICRNDYLILCSDGLSGKIQPEEIRGVIIDSPDLGYACRQLVQLANERGGEDNITVIIASFDGQGLAAVPQGKTITDSFTAIEPGRDNVAAEAPGASASIDNGTLPLASDVRPPEQKSAQTAASAAPVRVAKTEELSDRVPPPSPAAPSPAPPAQTMQFTANELSSVSAFEPEIGPEVRDVSPPNMAPSNVVPPKVVPPNRVPSNVEPPTVVPPNVAPPNVAPTMPVVRRSTNRTIYVVLGIVLFLFLLVAAYLIYKFVLPLIT